MPVSAMSSVLALESYLLVHVEDVFVQLPQDAEVIEMRGLLLLREPMVPLSSTIN